MKKLYLIRHAKSDWSMGLKDIDRTLNKRGQKQSKELGVYFNKMNIFPDLMIASIAKRTKLTAQNIAKEIDYPIDKIQLEPSIYEAHYEQLLQTIWSITNDVDTVFFIGHNPGVSDLTHYLTNNYVEFKTSCLAIIEFRETEKWEDINYATGKLVQFITPNLL